MKNPGAKMKFLFEAFFTIIAVSIPVTTLLRMPDVLAVF